MRILVRTDGSVSKREKKIDIKITMNSLAHVHNNLLQGKEKDIKGVQLRRRIHFRKCLSK